MEERCIYCDAIIPEGRLVCWSCEHDTTKEKIEKTYEIVYGKEDEQ